MPEINLSCACGLVQGKTKNVNAQSGNRIHCCCADCQKFAVFLKQDKKVLDQYGATDIFQMPIAHLTITQGNDQLALIRLTPKGLNRWYAKCCNTPIGNTLGSKTPFIGVIHNFMQHVQSRDQELGKTRGYIHCQSAKQPVSDAQQTSLIKISMRVLGKLISWKLKGLNQPSAFFNANGCAVSKPEILNK
ncbi:DUF6151 family protein [uncultured Paraglaciecola sp.]|uniref:DUF6151 family protein n=1 Tax=uncultured Paraglaciecola sp. TaxID=1765024 RepID=UPI0025EF07EA|nr:DUF6151 family protein [uncultured Paraglaciecola sp.]